MINKLVNFINSTQSTIYDTESLTILESIGKIIEKVNNCIEYFNQLENKTNDDYNNFISQIRDYKNEINELMKTYKGDVYEVYNEFKRSIENLDKINESVDYVKEQSEIVQKLAEENANKIKDGTIATHLDVDNAKTSVKEELSINMVNFVNVDKMSGNTDTEKIKNAITKAMEKNGGEIYFTNNKYIINERINIPKGIGFNGGFATFSPSETLEGYMFSINSTDLKTWDTQYPNLWKCDFKNVNFNNLNRRVGVYGIFNASQHRIVNCQFYGMTRSVKYLESYLDSKVIENITIGEAVGDEYQIDLGFLGDSVRLQNVHGMAKKVLRCNMINGGTIKSCILNGKVLINNCTALSLEGLHMENGYLEIVNSSCSVKDVFGWKQSGVPFISITSQYDNSKPINLENIKITYPMYNNIESDEVDINFTGNQPINIKNIYTSYEMSGNANSSYSFGVKTNLDWFNKYSSMLSINSSIIPNRGIINAPNNIYSSYGQWDKYFINRIESVKDESNPKMRWIRPIGTYYYRADLLYDNERMIGMRGQDDEKSIEVDEDSMVRFLQYGKSYMGGTILRLYRGTQSGIYDEYIDLPMISFSDYLKYDTGDSISHIFKWKVNPTKERLPLNECTRFIINGKNITCYLNDKPLHGTWAKGDVVFNNNIRSGSFEKWIFNGTEWIGINQL